jgi:hypothetical protein
MIEKQVSTEAASTVRMEKTVDADKLIQVSQRELTEKAESRSEEALNASVKAKEVLEQGLIQKTGDGVNANILTLIKEVKNLTASISKLIAKQDQPNAEPNSKEDSSDEDQATHQSIKTEGIADRIKRQFSIESMLDFNNDKGLITNILKKTKARNEYVESKQAANPDISKKQLRADFEERNALVIKEEQLQEEIDRKRSLGITKKELERSGITDKLKFLQQQKKELDTKYDVIKPTEPDQAEETPPVLQGPPPELVGPVQPQPVVVPEPAVLAEAVEDQPLPSSAAANEALYEQTAEIVKQTELMRSIDQSVMPLRILNDVKLDKAFGEFKTLLEEIRDNIKAMEGAGGGGILPGLPDLPDLPGRRTLGKVGGVAKKIGGLALRAAPFAAAGAAMYGVSNAGDWALGKMGVGKDAEGKDIQIDQKQDDANWNKMSWWQKAESGLARGVEKAGSFVGLDNLSREAQAKRIKTETQYLNPVAKAPVANVGAAKTTSPPLDPFDAQEKAMEANSAKIAEAAKKLKIDPNKAEGEFEGGVLTKITDVSTGKVYPVDVSKQDQAKVSAARTLSKGLQTPTPASADVMYDKSSEVDKSMKGGSTSTVVNAPQSTNIQQNTTYTTPTTARNEENTLQRYVNSRYAF